MARYGKNTKGQPTYNGVPFFARILYDSGFHGATGTDMAGHLANHRIERFNITEYLHVMSGTQENGLRLAELGKGPTYRFRPLAIGNFHQGFTFDPNALDIARSQDYRQRWNANSNTGPVYLGDEARDQLMSGMQQYDAIYRQDCPEVPRLNVYMPSRTYDSQDDVGSTFIDVDAQLDGINEGDWPTPYRWSAGPFGDWLGPDPYPGFAGDGGANYPQGYLWNDSPFATAYGVEAALAHGKTPIITIQAFHFTSAGRVPTRDEGWYQAVSAIVEGARGIAMWALGVQAGALHHGLVTAAEREATEAWMIEVFDFIAQHESVILGDPRPALLVSNSTDTGNPVQWCIDAMDRDIDAHWSFYDQRARRGVRNALQSGIRTKMPLLNQAGDVRTRVYEDSAGNGYVFAYNWSPFATNNVTFKWYRDLQRVEVLGGESRSLALGADKRSWTDSFGGSSSKNMATRACHVYKLIPVGGPVEPPTDEPALAVAPGSLSFTATQGQSAPAGKGIVISNPGSGTLNWTATANQPWVTLTPASGQNNATVLATVDHAMLGPGTHVAVVTVSAVGALGSPKTVSISFVVEAPQAAPEPLKLGIDAPVSGAGISGLVSVKATSQGGRASQSFEFYADDELINAQPSTTRTASFTWDTRKHINGTYELKAVVTDSDGASTSRSISVAIQNSVEGGTSETPGEVPASQAALPITIEVPAGKTPGCKRLKITLSLVD